MRIAVTLIFLAINLAAMADDLTIPNTFTPGTPARAADVNANFAAVEASVDDNAADIAANSADIAATDIAVQANTTSIAALSTGSGMLVYSQGNAVGRFLSSWQQNPSLFWLVSDTGFVFLVRAENNAIDYLGPEKAIYFSESDCDGRSYIGETNTWPVVFGTVFRSDGASPVSVYYSPRGSVEVPNTAFQSQAINGGCLNNSGVGLMIEVFANDDVITRVPNVAPTGPLVLGLP